MKILNNLIDGILIVLNFFAIKNNVYLCIYSLITYMNISLKKTTRSEILGSNGIL